VSDFSGSEELPGKSLTVPFQALLNAGSLRDIHPGSANHLQFVRLPEKILKRKSFCGVETLVCES
jgi:hypothetical protein